MTDFVGLAVAMWLGIGLGALYFGGLWLTVRRLQVANRPVLMALGSFLGRALLGLSGFYLIGRTGWEYLVVSLLGFVLVRTIFIAHRSAASPEEVNTCGSNH